MESTTNRLSIAFRGTLLMHSGRWSAMTKPPSCIMINRRKKSREVKLFVSSTASHRSRQKVRVYPQRTFSSETNCPITTRQGSIERLHHVFVLEFVASRREPHNVWEWPISYLFMGTLIALECSPHCESWNRKIINGALFVTDKNRSAMKGKLEKFGRQWSLRVSSVR